jgi:hypothetical protein
MEEMTVKKKNGVFFGIAALAMAAIFVLAGCETDTPEEGGGGSVDPAGTTFSIGGTFTKSGNVEVEVKFKLANAAGGGSRSVSRSVTGESYAIDGSLEDGDLTFRLTGTYDPLARSYTASAASSAVRYNISGSFNEAGVSLGSVATLLVKNSGGGGGDDEWSSFTFPVTPEDVTLTEHPLAEPDEDGISSEFLGWWNRSESQEGYTVNMSMLVSPFSATINVSATDPDGVTDYDNQQWTMVSRTGNDVIFAFPMYIPSNANQTAAAIDAFLASKSISAERITTATEDGPDWNFTNSPSPLQYYVDPNDPSNIAWCYFNNSNTDPYEKAVDQFYDSQYLTTYLVTQQVDPTIVYPKVRLAISGNRFTMTPYDMGGEPPTSVSAADAFTNLELERALVFTR